MAQCFTSIDFHKNNIPFYEYDIEKSSVGHDQYRAVGGRGVPVLLVNQSVIRGYSPDEILKYLEWFFHNRSSLAITGFCDEQLHRLIYNLSVV